MGGPLRLTILFSVALLTFTGCSEGGSDGAFPSECGLPSPDPTVRPAEVPKQFLLPGTEVRKVSDEGGVDVYALNVPLGVQESYDGYLEQLTLPEYQEVAVDNEGFEAEIYLREVATDRLLAIQIRRPGCSEASSVFVQVDNRDR